MVDNNVQAWARWYLYISHALVAFGDRLWQFAVPILFITIYPTSLLPIAVFQFALYFFRVMCFPRIGQWVDAAPRQRAVTIGTFGQCPNVALSVALLYVLGTYP